MTMQPGEVADLIEDFIVSTEPQPRERTILRDACILLRRLAEAETMARSETTEDKFIAAARAYGVAWRAWYELRNRPEVAQADAFDRKLQARDRLLRLASYMEAEPDVIPPEVIPPTPTRISPWP